MRELTSRLPIFLLAAAPALACSCGVWQSARQAWSGADIVFAGTIEWEVEHPLGGPMYFARVDEPFKNAVRRQLVVVTPFGCRGSYTRSERYVFYLRSVHGPSILAGCQRTQELVYAPDDLLFLRALPGSATSSRIAGLLTVAEDVSPAEKRRIYTASRVVISNGKRRFEPRPNADGAWAISGLEPGWYRIEVRLPPTLRSLPPLRYDRVSGGHRRVSDGWFEFELVPYGETNIEFWVSREPP